MTQEEYLTARLEGQIEWYDTKSGGNQKWFKRLQVAAILAAALIPFVTGYITESTIGLKVLAGVLGVLIAAITAVLGLYKFQENWLEYRTICESLRHEKYLFLTKTSPYDIEGSFPLLVQRVEGLISRENSNWVIAMKSDAKPKG